MIADDTLSPALAIKDELFQLCKWLYEKRDTEASARLVPPVDELTQILLEASKSKLQ